MDNCQQKEKQDYGSWQNQELLIEYKRTKDLKIKQELVMRYVYIIKGVAIQMKDIYMDFAQVEDIVHEGIIVLMNAIDKFEPEYNVKFETYIAKRVRGMVIDLVRSQDWVPRTVRKSVRDVEKMTSAMSEELGRPPRPQEIADRMEISMDKLQKILSKANLFYMLSLDMVLENSDNRKAVQLPSSVESEQPESSFLHKELRQVLAEAVKSLNEKEQIVISLYYVEELSMKEIAQVLEISPPRVSQLHANAVRKLKEYIEQEFS